MAGLGTDVSILNSFCHCNLRYRYSLPRTQSRRLCSSSVRYIADLLYYDWTGISWVYSQPDLAQGPVVIRCGGETMSEEGKSGKKLTIAHIMPWSGVGGVEIATLRLTDTTRDQFRHVAFCLHDATALRNSFEKMGIETITYSPPVPSLRHAVKYYKESLAVKRQLQAIGADIVHFSEINGRI